MMLQIISNDKVLLKGNFSMISLPGEMGRFAILDNHEPMIASVTNGEVEIKDYDNLFKSYVITSGIVCVEQNQCTVFTDKLDPQTE